MTRLYSLMSSARHSLDMTMYELADPQTVSILEADAARGVRVRVLLDRDYSGESVNAADYSELATHGVSVRWAYSGTIFHQKTITVDSTTSAIMTLNLTSRYYPTTRDFAVVTSDAADVSAVEQVFDGDWSASGPPAGGPRGDNLVWSPGASSAIVALIGSARHSLLVENEEMDDPAVTSALASAARRGVSVQVVMTSSPSWTSAFSALTAAGVHVRTYAADASLYIHAKVIVADGATAYIGSQNFSVSSLQYNRELGLITTVSSMVNGLTAAVQSDYAGATPYGAGPGSAPAPGRATNPAPATTVAPGRAWCQASAAPANDGYSGDYDVSVTSNQPDAEATASDASDKWSDRTNASGSVKILLYHTSSGEAIHVTVGGASCSTTA